VDQILRLMRATFLGDDRTVAPADPVGWVSSPVRTVSVPSGPGSWHGTVASVCGVSPSHMQRVIQLVALIWALTLGHASMVGSLAAREVAPAPKAPDVAAKVDRVVSDSQTHLAKSEHGSRLRSPKRSGSRSKIALRCHPNDDDDDDDYTSDDLDDKDDDETDVPIIFWLQDTVRYLIALDAESVPVWTEPPYSPFPAQQRLRC
jgi:hypothetical protein